MISRFSCDRTRTRDLEHRPARIAVGLLVALAFLLAPVALADDTVPYRHFTARDGLPGEMIHALAQGPDGRLWIGTHSGLAVYDGHDIREVSLPDSLGDPAVPEILARPDGTIWAALSGRAIVGIRRGMVHTVIPAPANTNVVRRLLPRGDTLVAVTRKGLWIRPPGAERVVKRPYDYPVQTGALATLEPSTGSGVVDAARGPSGTHWILDGRQGLGRLSLDGSVTFVDSSYARSEQNRWLSIRVGPEGDALLSRASATYHVDLASGRRTMVGRQGYTEVRVDGGAFYGVSRGRLERWTPQGTGSYGPAQGLPGAVYRTVLADTYGGLWIGTTDGLLYLPVPEARHASQIDGADLRWMDAFGVDSTSGELWLASWGSGVYRLRPEPARRLPGPSPKWTLNVAGRDGRLHGLSRAGWYRREGGEWTLVNGSLSATRGVVRPTGTGYFWTDDGLLRLRPRTGAVPDTLWHWPREERGFYDFTVAPSGEVFLRAREMLLRVPLDTSAAPDSTATLSAVRGEGTGGMVLQNEALWITFAEQGLIRLALSAPERGIEPIAPEVGAAALSSAGDSLLFVGSKDGLFVVDTRARRVRRRLSTADGLVSNSAYAARLYGDTLYVSHPEGLSKLPRSVLGRSPTPPTATLTQWSVNDSSRAIVDSTRLGAEERTVSFEFTGVQLARGRDVRYAYRLAPRDTAWKPARQAFTRYTDLSPGTYRFEVRAQLEGGPSGAPARMVFTIPRAYYETAWFRALAVLAVLVLVGGAFVWRARTHRRRQEKLRRLVDERTRRLAEEKRRTEEQAEKLAVLDEQKSRFFANISHELRTPLTILRGTLEDAMGGAFGKVPAPLRQQLGRMRGNVRRLRRLTEQLLDLARLETADPSVEAQARDLAALLRRCVQQFVPLAERRGVHLDCTTEVETHPCQFDPEKLETIVDNLLSNALKNTPEGGEVRAELRVEPGGPPVTILEVSDTGSGISAGRQEEIFERYVRGDESASGAEGAGIGLALALEYVELHGGTIGVESAPGEGSTFTARLPLPPADPETVEEPEAVEVLEAPGGDGPPRGDAVDVAAPSANDGVPQDAAEQPLVLVAEDNDEVRAYLRRHLSDDYHLVEATDGKEGLAKARSAEPDLILADLMMPEIDGLELCRRVRGEEVLGPVPIVLLTARATEEDAVEGLEAGADAYVTKPFSMEELQARIGRLLEARWGDASGNPASGNGAARWPAPKVEASSADDKFLERVTGAIDEHLSRTDFTVDDLAAEVGLSPRQLRRKLKRLTGETPAAFVRGYRLDAAAQLLVQEAGTVSEIAYRVGFGTPETFTKRFRERFGCPPSEYPDAAS